MTPILEEAIRDAVRNDLRDPESAMFKSIVAFRDNDGGIVGCGMTNAKNAYGGYVGFEPFRAFIMEAKGRYLGAGAVFGGGKYPDIFYGQHPMCDPRNW